MAEPAREIHWPRPCGEIVVSAGPIERTVLGGWTYRGEGEGEIPLE
jgi:hypothetical protein